VLVALGVYLLDQPVQRRHVTIVDSPSLVRDDFREAVRLRREEPRVGARLYRMAEVAATRGDAGQSANGASWVCERQASQPQ
jgi:hypothetical protein